MLTGDSIADDVSGRIGRIAIQIASSLFDGKNIEKKYAYEQLLGSFPAGVHLDVVTDDAIVTQVREWLSCLELSCSVSMVAVAGGKVSSSTKWMRDAFIKGTRNGTTGYLKCLASKSGNDQARWLAAADGTNVVCVPDVLLEGGDSLVGVDFRLVGHTAVKQTSDIPGPCVTTTRPFAGSKRSIAARSSSWAIARRTSKQILAGCGGDCGPGHRRCSVTSSIRRTEPSWGALIWSSLLPAASRRRRTF